MEAETTDSPATELNVVPNSLRTCRLCHSLAGTPILYSFTVVGKSTAD